MVLSIQFVLLNLLLINKYHLQPVEANSLQTLELLSPEHIYNLRSLFKKLHELVYPHQVPPYSTTLQN